MARGNKGGVLRAGPITTTGGYSGAASGVFGLEEATQLLASNSWPRAQSVPGKPTSVVGTSLFQAVRVSFTAPTDTGGLSITGYTVTAYPGGATFSGASSPILATGLSTSQAYTFTVKATNSRGTGPESNPSSAVTPNANGEDAYTEAGTYTWIAPVGVTSVCVVAIGGGGVRGAGGLGYKNNIAVTPGQSYTVQVGFGEYNASPSVTSTDSFFINTSTVRGGRGTGATGGTFTGDGGGNGGTGNFGSNSGGSGGGAGGYSGNGANGVSNNTVGNTGAGGGGGSGAGGRTYDSSCGYYVPGAAGGGTGLYGQGSNGAGGQRSSSIGIQGGFGGSGGNAGGGIGWDSYNSASASGGSFGGGGGGVGSPFGGPRGARGGVRIIYGPGRAFPSTNAGQL